MKALVRMFNDIALALGRMHLWPSRLIDWLAPVPPRPDYVAIGRLEVELGIVERIEERVNQFGTVFYGKAKEGKSSSWGGLPPDGRWVGTTLSGPPRDGTFQVSDFVTDSHRRVWRCVSAGSPGAWNQWTPHVTAVEAQSEHYDPGKHFAANVNEMYKLKRELLLMERKRDALVAERRRREDVVWYDGTDETFRTHQNRDPIRPAPDRLRSVSA